jgi:hypothetical protein
MAKSPNNSNPFVIVDNGPAQNHVESSTLSQALKNMQSYVNEDMNSSTMHIHGERDGGDEMDRSFYTSGDESEIDMITEDGEVDDEACFLGLFEIRP